MTTYNDFTTTSGVGLDRQETTAVINWVPVGYCRVLNGSVKAYAYVEGKKGRVQVVNDGSVNIVGRFSNVEMSAMIEALLHFA